MAPQAIGGSGGFINPSRVSTPRAPTSAAPRTGYARLPGSLQRAMGPPRIPPLPLPGAAAAAVPLWPLALAFLAGAATNLLFRALWNLWNSRPQQGLPEWGPGSEKQEPGPYNWYIEATHVQSNSAQVVCSTGNPGAGASSSSNMVGGGRNNAIGIRLDHPIYTYESVCSPATPPSGNGWLGVTFLLDGGGTSELRFSEGPQGATGTTSWKQTNTLTGIKVYRNWQLQSPPAPAWAPWPQPLPPFPEPEPLTEEPPQPVPPQRPPIAPPDTDVPPLTQPPVTPEPPPAPATPGSPAPGGFVAPLPWWWPFPSPAPGPGQAPAPVVTPVGPGTMPAPQPAPGPVVTPAPVEVIGDLVIGQPGTAPPPTLEGIAQEVGKIEQKTRYLIDKAQKNPPSDVIDGLDDLLDLLTNIYNFLTSVYGPGEYTLTAPCEEGVVATAEWSGGVGSMSLLGKKIDAVAELLQHHKDLRQPICHVKAVGQPVTVNFREV